MSSMATDSEHEDEVDFSLDAAMHAAGQPLPLCCSGCFAVDPRPACTALFAL
jgi:hypothetical protein